MLDDTPLSRASPLPHWFGGVPDTRIFRIPDPRRIGCPIQNLQPFPSPQPPYQPGFPASETDNEPLSTLIESVPMQTTNTVLMIRPTRFSFNQDTAANNRFQRPAAVAEDVQLKALQEFDGYVAALRGHGVEVLVHNDAEAPHTPDSIFPNNWWSSHPDGTDRKSV